MMNHPTWLRFAPVAAAALLAACGDYRTTVNAPAPPPPAANRLPASALASVEGLMAFLRALVVSDTGQPLNIDGVTLPVSDTAEPVNLGSPT